MFFNQLAFNIYRRFFARRVRRLFLADLIKQTDNFGRVTWLGYPIWQNLLDLWVIQETIAEVKPELLIETGTNKGGSARFYAHLFDLMGKGSVITVDVNKMHDLSHPRITFLAGDSTSPEIVNVVQKQVDACQGPVMVILDSDHSQKHVLRELECYAKMTTKGSYCLVQDGVIDVLSMFKGGRPGPLPAVKEFLKSSNEFEEDKERNSRFLITHHPKGWLKRK